jgi:hypothetical protein
VVTLFAEWWSGPTSADWQGQNTEAALKCIVADQAGTSPWKYQIQSHLHFWYSIFENPTSSRIHAQTF